MSLASFLVVAGLATAGVGFLATLRPLRFIRIRTRRAAAGVFLAGLGFAALGSLWPAPEITVRPRRSWLEAIRLRAEGAGTPAEGGRR